MSADSVVISSSLGDLQIIRIYHECEGRVEKSVPRITVWHHEACRVMTNGDPEGQIFYPTRTPIMDSFSYSALFYLFKISFQKSLNALRCNFHMVMSVKHKTESKLFAMVIGKRQKSPLGRKESNILFDH